MTNHMEDYISRYLSWRKVAARQSHFSVNLDARHFRGWADRSLADAYWNEAKQRGLV